MLSVKRQCAAGETLGRPIETGRSAGPRRASGALLAGVAVLAFVPGEASARTSASVLTRTQADALRQGALTVRIRADARRRVTLRARTRPASRSGAPRSLVLTPTTSLRFSRAGSRTVRLGLTAAGRAALRGCGDRSVAVVARTTAIRAQSTPRRRAQTRRPAFTGAARAVTATARLRGDPSGCYTVGVASRSINPDRNGTYAGQPVYLGGYGIGSGPILQGRPATGFLDDGIKVRALVVGDGKRHFASADIEAQGWFVATKDGPYGLIDMRKRVEQLTGGKLKASEVFVQSDHSHGGIDAMGVWGGMPLEYRAYIVRRTAEAVVDAFNHQEPGTLHYGTAEGNPPGDDKARLLSNQFGYDEANRTLDSEVRMLQARDGDGNAFASVLNFSAHTTVLGSSNTKATGDWVQQANVLLEKRYGGEAVTLVATLGRTQPADRGCQDKALKGHAASLCSLNEYAGRVVDRAAQAVAAARPITGTPVVRASSYLIQDISSNAILLGLLVGGDNPVFGAPLNRALTPPWLTGNVLGTVSGSARIGDVLLSSMPGESYPQIPLTVRSIVKPRGHMTMGLSNDQLGYIIAPFESYPEPIRRSFFNERGDEPSPIDNDNYFFNVSHTLGERLICSLLRGAGDVFDKGTTYRDAYERCPLFPNDLLLAPGADTN
jgi:hypothetical protein